MLLDVPDLWSLVRKRPQIDPQDLACAIQQEIQKSELDYRSRLLIKDSVEALRLFWGEPRSSKWLEECEDRNVLAAICRERFEEVGFPSLRGRLMQKTDPSEIRQYFEELGLATREKVRVYIAGAAALILPGLLHRHTDDIGVVDEVPEVFRRQPKLLDYLPANWQDRAHFLDFFGHLEVFLVDAYDVFLSKLFSEREKDRDDLRVLLPQLEKSQVIERLNTSAQSFLADSRLLELARKNWQILCGEPLPQ